AAEATRRGRQSIGAHPCADRAADRGGLAARDRGRHHGGDHVAAAAHSGGQAMKFGALPPREAEGAIAVHSIRKGGLTLKKGTRIGRNEIAALEAAKVGEIVVARLEPGDGGGAGAAAEEPGGVVGARPAGGRGCSGRGKLFAEEAGILVVDRAGVDALNDVDPSITFATLDAYAPVVAGKMIATVKIIPFAVAAAARDKAVAVARTTHPVIRV